MTTAININIPADKSFDPDELEEAFSRYFERLDKGEIEETDTIRLSVTPVDRELPPRYFDILPLSYLGISGSYPDVEQLSLGEVDDKA